MTTCVLKNIRMSKEKSDLDKSERVIRGQRLWWIQKHRGIEDHWKLAEAGQTSRRALETETEPYVDRWMATSVISQDRRVQALFRRSGRARPIVPSRVISNVPYPMHSCRSPDARGSCRSLRARNRTAYIRETIEDENAKDGLDDACRGTQGLIQAAFGRCKTEVVSKAALQSVNRRETGAESNERPLYTGQQVKTIRKCSDSWVHILRFLWRTAMRSERPKYEMTERQSWCLTKLREVTAPDRGPSNAIVRSRAERRSGRRQVIEDACLVLWIPMFDHELKDSEFKSGIISGLAMLGIDTQNGSWNSIIHRYCQPLLAS